MLHAVSHQSLWLLSARFSGQGLLQPSSKLVIFNLLHQEKHAVLRGQQGPSRDLGRQQPTERLFPKIGTGSGKSCRFLYTSLTTKFPRGRGGGLEPSGQSLDLLPGTLDLPTPSLAQHPHWVTSSPLPMGQAPSPCQALPGLRMCPWTRSCPPDRRSAKSSRNNYSSA